MDVQSSPLFQALRYSRPGRFVFDVARNLRAYRSHDPSMYGETSLLSQYLPPTGSFVEIGAFHPCWHSNTWTLAKAGWQGHAYEPDPRVRFLWRLFGRGHQLRVCAVMATPSEGATLWRVKRNSGLLSSTIPPGGEAPAASVASNFDSIRVPAVALADVMKDAGYDFGSLTLLATDVEGYDFDLVESLLRDVPIELRPKFLLVEDHDGRVTELLAREGWEVLGSRHPSVLLQNPSPVRSSPSSR